MAAFEFTGSLHIYNFEHKIWKYYKEDQSRSIYIYIYIYNYRDIGNSI